MKKDQEPLPSFAEIEDARSVLSHYLTPTPLLLNTWLSEAFGCELYLKLETMQPIGSFKIRGATFKIACLSQKERRKGVIAASAVAACSQWLFTG